MYYCRFQMSTFIALEVGYSCRLQASSLSLCWSVSLNGPYRSHSHMRVVFSYDYVGSLIWWPTFIIEQLLCNSVGLILWEGHCKRSISTIFSAFLSLLFAKALSQSSSAERCMTIYECDRPFGRTFKKNHSVTLILDWILLIRSYTHPGLTSQWQWNVTYEWITLKNTTVNFL